MTKHNLCLAIISLENEIEDLSSISKPVQEQEKELASLYKHLTKCKEVLMPTRRGFTLIELLVIVIIIAVLGLMVGGISGCQQSEIYEGSVTSCAKLDAQFAEGSQVFSFAVELDLGDEFLNFSTEDRQFATIQSGDRIQVKVFKYPSWNFKKAGTYHGGRLLKKLK